MPESFPVTINSRFAVPALCPVCSSSMKVKAGIVWFCESCHISQHIPQDEQRLVTATLTVDLPWGSFKILLDDRVPPGEIFIRQHSGETVVDRLATIVTFGGGHDHRS